MKKNLDIKNKGITLVALVITIIILLILAGITINSLTGSGLFENAELAKEKYKITEYEEKVKLAITEVSIENLGVVTLDNLINKIYKQNIVPEGSIEKIDETYAKIETSENYIFLITTETVEYIEDEDSIPGKTIKYTIEYNGNGNTGGSTENSTHIYGEEKELTKNGYTKDNYVFKGWAKTSDGEVVYTDGQNIIDLTSVNGEKITLYAVWRPNQYYIIKDGIVNSDFSSTSYQPVSDGLNGYGYYTSSATYNPSGYMSFYQSGGTISYAFSPYGYFGCNNTDISDYQTIKIDWSVSYTGTYHGTDILLSESAPSSPMGVGNGYFPVGYNQRSGFSRITESINKSLPYNSWYFRINFYTCDSGALTANIYNLWLE